MVKVFLKQIKVYNKLGIVINIKVNVLEVNDKF